MGPVADMGGIVEDDDEAEAFRVLFEEHLPSLWAYARRRSPSATDADDLAAEAFAVAWRRRRELPTGDEVRPWLFGVARNLLANQHRAAQRRGRLQAKLVATITPADLATTAADAGIDADRRLGAALAALDPDERELLLLRAWDGLPVGEIAALLGCTPNAASIRLHRARGALADLLDPKEPVATRTSGRRPDTRGEEAP